MTTLVLDTATPATVVGVAVAPGAVVEARDDAPKGRPAHTESLLTLGAQALSEAGVNWRDVATVAVGLGPGGFTGLRIGVATARALAQSLGANLVGVSSLRALARAAGDVYPGRPVLAAIDARRGELFVAVEDADGSAVLGPMVIAPEALADVVAELGLVDLVAVGDGALRYPAAMEAGRAWVPEAGDPAHRITAKALFVLAQAAEPMSYDRVVPDYLRAPDAQPRATVVAST